MKNCLKKITYWQDLLLDQCAFKYDLIITVISRYVLQILIDVFKPGYDIKGFPNASDM